MHSGHPTQKLPGGLFAFIGIPLNDGTWTYTWEKGRQLQQMATPGEIVDFKYNENGLRIQKVATSTGTTNYTLHGKNIVHMTRDKGQQHDDLHFFYDASNKPAIVEFNGTKYAYVHNLQGDIVAILDSNGTAVVNYKYDAWGRQIGCDVAAGNSNAAALSMLNPFRYRGYVYDEETGLYYLRSRYYNGIMHRFLNSDSLVESNIFAYCNNNPINEVDPSGCESITLTDDVKDSSIDDPANGLPMLVFLDLIGQAVNTPGWKYKKGYSQWKTTDCVGLPKYILNWYYSYDTFESLHMITKGRNPGKIYNQVIDMIVYGLQDGKVYPIEDPCAIPLGAAVFIYDPSDPQANETNKGWIHVGIYNGLDVVDEDGVQKVYPHTVAHAIGENEGVRITRLTERFTHYGYIKGVDYSKLSW